MSFLTAEWRKLALINYEIDPAILQKYIPAGTELDYWEGKCYVSLVGFMFVNTRLLGIKIPFHTNFEEVNLRFYVKRLVNNEWRRGVVFIKEIVPKPALSLVANTIYNENYQTLPMQHSWQEHEVYQEIIYKWKLKSQWQTINLTTGKIATEISAGSEAEFVTEHYWGYAKASKTRTNEYQVTHPRWLVYPVLTANISVDFSLNYGSPFSFLNMATPLSVMLAEGSEITVESKNVI